MKTIKHGKRRNKKLIALATGAFVVCVAIMFGVVANVTPAPNLLSNSDFTESVQSGSYDDNSSSQDNDSQDQSADGQLQADSSVANNDSPSSAYTLYNSSIAAYTYTQSADEAEELTQAGWQAIVDNTDSVSVENINFDNSNNESDSSNNESDDNASDSNANDKNEDGEDGNPFLSYSNESEYYVTFNANGGKLGTTYVKVTIGQAMPQITLPTRTGYTFDGYFDAKTGGIKYYTNTGASAKNWDKTSNAELYAHWSVNTYTVNLDDNGGSGGAGTINAKFGVALPSVTMLPTRDGYTFTGYYDSKSANATKYYNADGTSAKNWDKGEDATLYAMWSANTYTVTLDNKEATTPGTGSVTATFDQPLPTITSPAKTGYTFAGYYDSEEEEATQYYYPNGSSVKAWDIADTTTLVAKWTANSYTVMLDNNGATTAGTASVDATYDQDMPSISVPTKTGYTFGGYYDSLEENATKYYRADGTSDKTWDKVVNATLYAKWTTGSTTITLDGNGATTAGTASVVAAYGQAMPAIEKLPEKTGHTFEGFFDGDNVQYYNSDGSSARDWDKTDATDTLTAKWSVCTYNVVLDPNEGTGGSSVVVPTYGQAMPTIIPPTQDGFNFEGYFDTKEETTGQVQYYDSDGKSKTTWDKTTDTTLYAHWIVAATLYEITATYNGKTVYFVPAFADTGTGYLKNITFYNKNKKKIVFDTTNTTMNAVYQSLYKDKNEEEKPYYVSNTGPELTFYGVLDEKWDNVFKQAAPAAGNAEGLGDDFKTWLNNNGLRTVYFTQNDDITPTSTGNWDMSTEVCPQLNGVNYSNSRSGTSTFYEAYGINSGGVLSTYSYYPWSSCAFTSSNAYGWYAHQDRWSNNTRTYNGGVIVSKSFGLKSMTKTYTNSSGSQTVTFVPAFKDGSADTYLKNVKFYNKDGKEITAITKAITDTTTQGRLTMYRLYTNYLKSSDENLKPAYVSNSGAEVTFYGVLIESWNNVFDSSTTSGKAQGYNKSSTFYTDFLDDSAGIGTIYFTGPKTAPTAASTPWTTASDPPKLNDVYYSNKNSGYSTFYEAYGGARGGVISSGSYHPWSSCADSSSSAFNWLVAGGSWDSTTRDASKRGVIVSQTF